MLDQFLEAMRQPEAPAWFAAVAATVSAAATVVYMLVAVGQLGAIRRQADISERALSELERPWVLITESALQSIGSRWFVVLTLKNCGRTPALNVLRASDWGGEVATSATSDIAGDPVLIGPGDTAPWRVEIPALGVRGFLSGRITYRDVFRNERTTTFCLAFDPHDHATGVSVGPLNSAS